MKEENLTGKVILDAQNLSYSYSSRVGLGRREKYEVFSDITFSIDEEEKVGIIGKNGCGKSSLLKVLAGIVSPSSGAIACPQGVSRSLLSLGLGFNNHLSGRDNVLLSAMLQGVDKKNALSLLSEVKEFSELGPFFDKPVHTYSAGMRSRLGFSASLITNVDILLIDEVLSVGDEGFKKKAQSTLLDKMKTNMAVIFVSHAMSQVEQICDRVIWLDNGHIKMQGNPKKVIAKYRESFS